MKKLISVVLVCIMMLSFVLSVSAASSPQATEHPTTPAATTPGNSGGTSPKTGDPMIFVVGLGVLALGLGALAVKKIKE
ncbi:MAG: LPXTG cell wall anchor domain-containing protein [Ruminococcus sp.]|nr:LPXTG cell wall anchor domain-containing protein [Ruminococcus sp.]